MVHIPLGLKECRVRGISPPSTRISPTTMLLRSVALFPSGHVLFMDNFSGPGAVVTELYITNNTAVNSNWAVKGAMLPATTMAP
jgi:hypothetical protein